MLFLAFNNNENAVIDKKDLSDYSEYYSNIKVALILATDISCFIKLRGAIALSTFEKMINIDLEFMKVNKKSKKTVKFMILEILEDKYSIKPMELKYKNVDDEEFIKEYRKTTFNNLERQAIKNAKESYNNSKT